MGKTIHISVADKVATYLKRDGFIVCENNDYTVEFSFDSEWTGQTHKTARFVWNGQYYDVEFDGTTCAMPEIRDATLVEVGVYAGTLKTTTPAYVPAEKSILSANVPPNPNYGEGYTTEAIAAANRAEAAAQEIEDMTATAHSLTEGSQPTVTKTGGDGQPVNLDFGIPTRSVTVDDALSETSENPVQNKVVTKTLTSMFADTDIIVGNFLMRLSTGEIVTGSNWHGRRTHIIPTAEGEVFHVKGQLAYTSANVCNWCFFGADLSYISGGRISESSTKVTETDVTIPAGVSYVRFASCLTSNDPTLEVYKVGSRDDLIRHAIQPSDIQAGLGETNLPVAQNSLTDEIVKLNPMASLISGNEWMKANGTIGSGSIVFASRTQKIPVKFGETYRYLGIGYSIPAVIWFAADKTTVLSTDALSSKTSQKEKFYTVPELANYAVFQSHVYTEDDIPLVFELENITEQKKVNVLAGKKLVVCGDSFSAGTEGMEKFTEGRFKNQYKTYAHRIALRNNMQLNNLAHGGQTLAQYDGSDIVNCFSYANGPYTQIDEDADYIIIKISANDEARDIPLGTIDDTTNTTVYGAWNVVLQHIINTHPVAKIGILTHNGIYDNNGGQRNQAIINICNKWGIPYLDEANDTKVPLLQDSHRPNVTSAAKQVRNQQFMISAVPPTNRHPNTAAHAYESTFVEAFLRTL